MKIDAEEVLRIARQVARNYRRRCWWADMDDLIQTASVAVLEAQATFDPQVGIRFSSYASVAASRQVMDALWEESSPVSGGFTRVGPVPQNEGKRAPLFDDQHPVTDTNPGEALDDYRWRLRVRARLRKLAARTKNGHLANEVLIRGRSSGEVMRETGEDVYSAVHLTRRKVRTDAVLHKLLRRRPR